MSESLRDQLLKAGFKPAAPSKSEKRVRHESGPRTPREPAEPDLAHAFALRAKAERAERQSAEREAREKAEARRERKRKVQELVAGKALNESDAEQPRHFEFAGKIRRVYVTPDQLLQLNTGDLGIVMHGGRALLVAHEIAEQVRAFAPELVPLLADPAVPAVADGVPDDLMW